MSLLKYIPPIHHEYHKSLQYEEDNTDIDVAVDITGDFDTENEALPEQHTIRNNDIKMSLTPSVNLLTIPDLTSISNTIVPGRTVECQVQPVMIRSLRRKSQFRKCRRKCCSACRL